jgi:hypothetical protein
MHLAAEQLGKHGHQIMFCPTARRHRPEPLPTCNRSNSRGYVCVAQQDAGRRTGARHADIIVPPASYLMIGDNRDNSEDGRLLGVRARGESGRQSDPDLVQLGPEPQGRPGLEPDRRAH